MTVKEAISSCEQEKMVVEYEKKKRSSISPFPVYPSKSNYSQEAEIKSGEKSFLLTLFLSIMPIPGLHRLYTGHIVIGVIQFFTLGGYFVWNSVDFLLVVTNNFRDYEGKKLRGYNRLISLLFFMVWTFFWGMLVSFFVATIRVVGK